MPKIFGLNLNELQTEIRLLKANYSFRKEKKYIWCLWLKWLADSGKYIIFKNINQVSKEFVSIPVVVHLRDNFGSWISSKQNLKHNASRL